MYDIEACINEDTVYEETHSTLQAAVDAINRHLVSCTYARCWINGKCFPFFNGCVRDSEGEPLSTNEGWHELYAPQADRILPRKAREEVVDRAMVQLARIRAAHARPTNPATLIAIGKLEA